jgi:hypothetical protein
MSDIVRESWQQVQEMKYIKLGWDIPIFGKGDRIEL